MKIYKITEASKYLGISINSLKTLANNGKLNSFKTGGEHRRFREDDLDAYMGVKKEKYMKIERIWAMPSRWTFTIKPIKELLQREVISGQKWIDPFAGYNSPATCRNDIDPEANAEYHEDALEFLKRQSDDEDFLFDGALFDPPYSSTQAKRKYQMLEKDFTAEMGRKEYWSKCKREIARIVKPGGRVISFGWNSGGMGKNLGFELEYVLLVPHGAGRNDTIVTLETKSEI